MILVAAALIVNRGRMLLAQRPAGTHLAGLWEFPGGKVEPGEEPAQGLRRELREELGIEVEQAAEITRFPYEYPGRAPLVLIFYRVERFRGEVENRGFAEVAWVVRGRLPEYDFLEGDVQFVGEFARGLHPDPPVSG